MSRRGWVLGSVLLATIRLAWPAQTDRVSQWGITFYFDRACETGRFANGDYWVVGPVTIDSIAPAAEYDDVNNGEIDAVCTGGSAGTASCAEWCASRVAQDYSAVCLEGERGYGVCHCQRIRNGWEVNPVVTGGQGFDDRSHNADVSLIPDLPFQAAPGQSIVKTVSLDADSSSCRPCLRTAAVLTVVEAIPPDSGRTVFRPPYVGTDKPYYSVDDLRTGLLPSLAPVPLADSDDWGNVSLEKVCERYRRVQLDHKGGLTGRSTHPSEHMPDYGGDIGSNNGDAVLRLCLDEPLDQKMPALIAFVQYGIDIHHAVYHGQTWPGGGGHRPGQLIALAFSALMLDDDNMKASLASPTDSLILHERATMFWSERQGRALYGYFQHTGPDDYWERLATESSGGKSMRDIYGYIDGGWNPGGNYQGCCTSQPWKGEALCFHLIPELKQIWYDTTFFDYVDRWVNHGVWTQPDPCAPVDQGGGHDPATDFCVLDPDLEYFTSPTDFGCKDGEDCGRFPEKHGTIPDGGGRYSRFQAQMWDAYRHLGDSHTAAPTIRQARTPTVRITPNPYTTSRGPLRINLAVARRDELVEVALYSADGALVKRFRRGGPAGRNRTILLWDTVHHTPTSGMYYIVTRTATRRIVSRLVVIE